MNDTEEGTENGSHAPTGGRGESIDPGLSSLTAPPRASSRRPMPTKPSPHIYREAKINAKNHKHPMGTTDAGLEPPRVTVRAGNRNRNAKRLAKGGAASKDHAEDTNAGLTRVSEPHLSQDKHAKKKDYLAKARAAANKDHMEVASAGLTRVSESSQDKRTKKKAYFAKGSTMPSTDYPIGEPPEPISELPSSPEDSEPRPNSDTFWSNPGAVAVEGPDAHLYSSNNADVESLALSSGQVPPSAQEPGEVLLNAVLVDGDEENSAIELPYAEAKVVSPWRKRLIAGGICLLIVGIVVAVTVPLTTRNSEATFVSAPTAAPEPTLAPTSAAVGDGRCDVEFNILDLDFDGGDCCESTCLAEESFTCGKDDSGFTDVGYFFCEQQVNTWAPNSGPIVATDTFARLGASVAMSANGLSLVVGEPGSNSARLFDKDGSKWVQRATLEGPVGSAFGSSVVIASGFQNPVHNPSALAPVTIAVGGPEFEDGMGMARIYDCQNQGCVQVGNDIVGESGGIFNEDFLGRSLSLSRDGNRLSVALRRGPVRIYDRIRDNFVLQDEIEATGTSPVPPDEPLAVSLSDDGLSLVVAMLSFRLFDVPEPFSNVLVHRVYVREGANWTGKGNEYFINELIRPPTCPLYSFVREEYPLQSVVLSGNGLVLAIGALYDGELPGIEVLQWNDTNWEPRGGVIAGNNDDDLTGWSVDLSSDGLTVAVGTGSGSNGNETIRVFRWNGTDHEQLWNSIPGGEESAVAFSEDGTALAVGLPDSASNTGGEVQVYEFLPPPKCAVGSSLLRVSLTTDINAVDTRWTVVNISGAILQDGGPYRVPEGSLGLERTSFVDEICLVNGECVFFTVYFGGGLINPPGQINLPGGYSLFLDGAEIPKSAGVNFESTDLFDRISIGDCSCAAGQLRLRLVLETDFMPEDMDWDIADTNSGEVLLQGGPYSDILQATTIVEEVCLSADACTAFTLRDASGDGFGTDSSGLMGVGGYTLFLDAEEVASGGGDFGFETIKRVGNCSPTSAPTLAPL